MTKTKERITIDEVIDKIKKYITDPENYSKIENVWLNQNLILNANEVKLLKQKRKVKRWI